MVEFAAKRTPPNTSRNKSSHTHRTENKTTDVLIHQHSRKLLKMEILMSETCWAHNKWNRIACVIKLVFHSSAITVQLSAEDQESCTMLLWRTVQHDTRSSHQCWRWWRTRMIEELNRKYKNVYVGSIVTYLRLCEPRQKEKEKSLKKWIVVKAILHNEMNSRCQVDLIDIQSNPDRDMKFILVYQDHLTKFALKSLYTVKELMKWHIILWIFSQLLWRQTFSTPTTRENFATKS